MTDLLLSSSEQAALRAVIASDPVPGAALPAECALAQLARLVDCDALGIALVDATGTAVEEAALPRDGTADHAAATGDAVTLGLTRRDRAPATVGPGRQGVAVLSLSVRNGPDHVVTLWLVRRTRDFSERDHALLALVAPALERLLRERPVALLPPSLTVQERRVLRLLATGLSNAEIADRLVVAPCTVRKHLENAYRKLGVTNRLAAVHALEPGRAATTAPSARLDSFA
jgi:ATP/maltotriose-dependent transcriptional regulator MalT